MSDELNTKEESVGKEVVNTEAEAVKEKKVRKTPVKKVATKTPIKESNEKEPTAVDILADLPESVKKKLEQAKIERAKTKNIRRKSRKKQEVKNVKNGKVFIQATYNNTMVSMTDMSGNVLSWASAGVAGFKGSRKSTSYAAQIVTKIAAKKAQEVGLEVVDVFVKGVGTGRESAVRTLNAVGFTIKMIKDTTPIPHNGCRAKKPRRV